MNIFVIDEHPLMREAVAALLRRLDHSAIVIEVDSLEAALSAAQTHGAPGMICLDLLMQGYSGVAAVSAFKRHFPDAPLIVLTAAPEQTYKDLALQVGAAAFIHKSASASEISNVLRVFQTSSEEGDSTAPPEKLSKRQKQLLKLLDKGMSNRDIAEALEISEHTVKVHLWRLFRRINVKSRSQATHLARTHGLL
jgi:DNA-binding NarL/FixJ family response regulator